MVSRAGIINAVGCSRLLQKAEFRGGGVMELPDNVKAKVDHWLGHYTLLHVWICEDAYRIVAESYGLLYFLRVFSLGQGLALSQDGRVRDLDCIRGE